MSAEPFEIKVLVGSANLGNAQPDEASWGHWIPENGSCQQVLRTPPPYPLRRMDESANRHLSPTGAEPDDVPTFYQSDEEDNDSFDIVVLGMQESTFDPYKEGTVGVTAPELVGSPAGLDGSSSNSPKVSPKVSPKGGNGSSSIGVMKTLASQTGRTLSTLHTHTGKTLSTLQTLAASRDHHASSSNNADFAQQWLGGTHVLHALLAQRLPSYERIV